jgi:hypothetical protein
MGLLAMAEFGWVAELGELRFGLGLAAAHTEKVFQQDSQSDLLEQAGVENQDDARFSVSHCYENAHLNHSGRW